MRALKEGVDEINIFYGYGDSSRDVKIDVMNRGVSQNNGRRETAAGTRRFDFHRACGSMNDTQYGWVINYQSKRQSVLLIALTAAELIRNLVIEVDFGTRNAVPESIKSAYWVSDVSSIRCIDGAGMRTRME